LFEAEADYWGISLLKRIELELQAIFNSKPEIATDTLAKFEELGVFDFRHWISEGKIQVDLKKEIKRNVEDSDNAKIDGFIKKNKLEGVGRKRYSKMLYEGAFLNNKLHGFGRAIQSNGAYYIGEWEDDLYHGQGKHVSSKGTIKEGRWDTGRFKG